MNPEQEQKTKGEMVIDGLFNNFERLTFSINVEGGVERELTLDTKGTSFVVSDKGESIFEVNAVIATPDGWVSIIDMSFTKSGEESLQYKHKGIASRVYDAVEKASLVNGAQGMLPSYSMTDGDNYKDKGIVGGGEFWKSRMKKKFPHLDEDFIDDLISVPNENRGVEVAFRLLVLAKLLEGSYDLHPVALQSLRDSVVKPTLKNLPEDLKIDLA